MARPAGLTEPLEKRNVRLFKGDYAEIGNLFPTVGAAVAIRALVRQTIIRAKAAAGPLDLDLSDIDLEDGQ